MPSPFPGMNPYLEHPFVWADFHDSWITAVRDALVPQVVPRYYVGIQQAIHLRDATDPGDAGELLGYPDLAVTPGLDISTGGGTLTVTAPARVMVPPTHNLLRMSYMEIRDTEFNDLIAVIELLSPSNKGGSDRRAYLDKWQAVMESRTHFIEIDLLRAGPPTPWLNRPASDYSVTVSRWEARPVAERWPIQLRERLPIIPVPLRGEDPEPTLDLQAILHRVYDAGAYQYRLYRRQPDPPLSADDQAWADGLIRTP